MSNDNKKVGVAGEQRDSNGAAVKSRAVWQHAKSRLTGTDEPQSAKDSCVENGGQTYCPPPLAPSGSTT